MPSLIHDWRHRPTHKRVWGLATPMILSNISVPLVALVDTAVIGHLPHAHQLGAVAVGSTLYSFMASGMVFLRMGSTGFAAQATGRADGAALRQILLQGLLLALILSIGLITLALPFSQAAMNLMQASPDLHQLTLEFFYTRLYGLPATLAIFALVGWLLGTQNARAPLAILLVTNLANIAFNLWFVIGLDWGVVGSARASVLAEWLGVLLGLVLAWRRLRLWPGQMLWQALARWHNWRPLLGVNRDIFLRTLALQSVMFMITAQGARLGDATVAANALLLNGLLLTAHALDGLAHAVEALCGHAIGARDRTTLRRSLVVAGGWSLIASLLFALAFTLGGHWFVFMQTDIAQIRETALTYLPYLALTPLLGVWSYLLDGLFIGATRAREMRNAMLVSVVLLAPFAALASTLDNHALWLTFLLFMLLRGLTLGIIAWRLNRSDGWFAH
ncbi:MATE family efflux transporter [Pseudomonas sp. LJDD11]|uniref:MATE family efflux transporter n=1 Tax=Pseudomonas sp. LJDD11 TaxID=2931984 RepID=UPI00211C6AB7|nr:MATE family efflux transporter [Pseudomonas sp. LJDD11]MCQ9425228.1 MATE family efflux transporter [Pseudomonas sp. LJDD11]